MSTRKKLIAIAAVILAAAAAVWLLLRNGAETVSNRTDVETETSAPPSEGDAPLTHDDQTPPVELEPETPTSEEPSKDDSMANDGSASSDSIWIPPKYVTVEDALDEVARLIRAEWDVLIKAMPRDELLLKITGIITDRIMTDPKYADLYAAMQKFFEEYGIDDARFSSHALKVRAGIEPESSLWIPYTLPNGETMKVYRNMKIIVKWRQKGKLTEEGRLLLEKAQRRETDLLVRLSVGDVSEISEASILAELENVQNEIKELQTPFIFDMERTFSRGTTVYNEDGEEFRPEIKVVEVGLGLIERGE